MKNAGHAPGAAFEEFEAVAHRLRIHAFGTVQYAVCFSSEIEQHRQAGRRIEVGVHCLLEPAHDMRAVSYTHLRAHETELDLVCRPLLEKKKHNGECPYRKFFAESCSTLLMLTFDASQLIHVSLTSH